MLRINELNDNINLLTRQQKTWIDENNRDLGVTWLPSLVSLLEDAVKNGASGHGCNSGGGFSSMSVIDDRAFILREEINKDVNEAIRVVGSSSDFKENSDLHSRLVTFARLAQSKQEYIDAAIDTTSMWMHRIEQLLNPSVVAVPKVPCPYCNLTHYTNSEGFINRVLIATQWDVTCMNCGSIWDDTRLFADNYLSENKTKAS